MHYTLYNKIMGRRILFVCLLCIVVWTSAPVDLPRAAARSADVPARPVYSDGSIRFERITNDQGLSMSVVQAIAQDQRGFIWFGTQDGLNRYDGYQFKIYKHSEGDSKGLSGSWINALLVDPRGDLWIGTQGGGLNRLDPATERFTQYQHIPDQSGGGLSSSTIHSLSADSLGRLYVGTDRGVDVLPLTGGEITPLSGIPGAPEALASATVFAILEDHLGRVWIGSNRGLIRYDPTHQEFTTFRRRPSDPNSLSNNTVTSLLEDRSGRLWVGTRAGLDCLDENGLKIKNYSPDSPAGSQLSSGSVTDLYEDEDGTIWIATWEGGLNRLDPVSGIVEVYQNESENPNSLSSNHLQKIFADTSGLIWIGTWGGGLSRFDPASEQFLHYYSRPGVANSLANNMVWAVFEENGELWVGTVAGLDRIDRAAGIYHHYRHTAEDPHSLPADLVGAIFRDDRGRLWVSTSGGNLSLYDRSNDRFINYRLTSDEGFDTNINAITNAGDGRIWVGAKAGIFSFAAETGRFEAGHLANPAETNRPSIYALKEYGDRLWVGRSDGLRAYRSVAGELQPVQATGIESLSAPILSIYPDRSGILWLGSIGSGLIRFDPGGGSVRFINEPDGLPNSTVYGVLEDDAGRLWLSTNKGLASYDPNDGSIRTYTANDGLQSNEFNSNAFHQSARGEMFFGGINGVTAFYPENISENTFLPPVVLTSLTQNGQPIAADRAVESLTEIGFKWPDNFFEFEMAALSFRQPEQNRYAYMLEGYDRDWVYTGNNRFGRYANLPGGSYRLRIKAANSDGYWNEAGTVLQVHFAPPFWQTWLFRIGLGLALAVFAFAGYRVRLHGIERNNRLLTHQVQERTREIERRHRELEALYHADEELYRNIDLDDVLQALVDAAVRILPADLGALLVWDDRHERLVLRASRGFKPETIPLLSFSPEDGLIGIVGRTGEPVWVPDVALETRLVRKIIDAEGIRACLHVPIKIDGAIFGVFSADYLEPRPIGDSEVRVLSSLAERAALAIQNAQIFERSQAQAIVEERSRLARELHDAVTQTLFSASLLADALPDVFDKDPKEGREMLGELRQLNRGALAEMRTLLLELRPSALTEASLEDLLSQLGEAAAGREGIPVRVECECACAADSHPALPADVHIALYRIAQEALNNALRHAHAANISIRLSRSCAGSNDAAQGLALTIHDDGRGFDPLFTPADHFGLGIMTERAESIGANFTIESRPGAGTRVSVVWPAPGSANGGSDQHRSTGNTGFVGKTSPPCA